MLRLRDRAAKRHSKLGDGKWTRCSTARCGCFWKNCAASCADFGTKPITALTRTRSTSRARFNSPRSAPAPAYFVEIKYGLSLEETIRSIRRKYSANHRTTCNRLVVVVRDLDAAALQTRLRDCVCSSLNIEIWDEAWLLREIKLRYGIAIDSLVEANITALHRSILQANWNRVFDSEYYEILASALLWHFDPWTLKRLHERERLGPADIWRPGNYLDIAVVMGHISSYSAYVRDTPDQGTMQQILTAYYSQSRHAVHEYGGMFYQRDHSTRCDHWIPQSNPLSFSYHVPSKVINQTQHIDISESLH